MNLYTVRIENNTFLHFVFGAENNALLHPFIVHIYFVLFYTLLLVLVTVYLSSHSSVMFLISCHIMSFIIFKSFAYSCHLLLCFMHAYTLKVETRKNYMYSKVQSLYKTVISIYMTETRSL